MLSGPGGAMMVTNAADAGWGARVAMPYAGELYASALRLIPPGQHRHTPPPLA